MKVVWDLDGVLRDLNGHLMHMYDSEYPTEWNFKYGGKSLFDCIREHMDILTNAPPTAYLKVAKAFCPDMELWTSQPDDWRPYTEQWIEKHIGKATVYFLKSEEKEARLELMSDTILVEDTPNFKNYDRVLLIDRPYNQSVKMVPRIYGTKHLNNMLELIRGMDE